MEMNVSIKELFSVEFDSVWDADVAHVATTASGLDRLHHRLLGADALQHRVRTDSVGELFNAGHALVTALRNGVSRTWNFAQPIQQSLGIRHTLETDSSITHSPRESPDGLGSSPSQSDAGKLGVGKHFGRRK